MEVKMIIKEEKGIVQFSLVGDHEEFKESIIKTKEVDIHVAFVSKTRISISMQSGRNMFGLNYENKNFKQFKQISNTLFSRKPQVKYLFVKSKPQNYEVFLQYIKESVLNALKDLNIELDSITINIVDCTEKYYYS